MGNGVGGVGGVTVDHVLRWGVNGGPCAVGVGGRPLTEWLFQTEEPW